MHHLIFSRGPIKLYPLPGTEEYVRKVAKWLAGNFLKDIGKDREDIAKFFFFDEEEVMELDKHLHSDEELLEFIADSITGGCNYFSHRNGAIEVSLKNSARGKDVFIFHTFSQCKITDYNGVNLNLSLSDQELLLYNTLDAFMESKVDSIRIMELNLGQARSDRPKGRGSCNLRTFFRNITANGADHIIMYQIHSMKSLIGIDIRQTVYDNLRGEALLKKYILRNHVKTTVAFEEIVKKDWIFSSVDAGGKEFAASFSKSFQTPLVVVDKRRNSLTNNVEEVTILKPDYLSIEGKTVFIVDDMIDSGGSIVDVCKKYKELGAKEVNVAVVYGLFSPPAEERLSKLVKDGVLNKVIVTDLILHSDEFFARNPYIEVADTTYTTARVIQKTNQGRSLDKYFKPLDAIEYLATKVEPESKS
ncbi:MAG: hypothetical protein A2015_04100 [Spirochaetes bacterium GWF1_31_7]|nr:MAG: hypothetical protein A2Y30_14655 [Spirochaetes bacterium GWE1_32_154]OHD48674.1 MAG: hypothetical protein A2015_04100 [Spirochaetes bacterium GWF1_31_7]OHD50195.1 MAG: hypothetical protein A2Y29_12700 [Spirochaetes bacterium GWE2_31_10]HBD94024.1 hypothetical protein [Spirochaetia bacterium]HBI38668.1 hypothetical protein [Spirochaetia bacterium]